MAGSCRLATLQTQEVVPQGVLLLYRNSDFGPDDPGRWSGVNSRIRTGRRRTIRFYSPLAIGRVPACPGLGVRAKRRDLLSGAGLRRRDGTSMASTGGYGREGGDRVSNQGIGKGQSHDPA